MAALTQRSQPFVVWNTAFAMLVAIAGVSMASRAFAADPPSEKDAAKGAATKSVMGDGSVRTLVPAVKTAPVGVDQKKKGGGNDNELIGLLRPIAPEGAKQVNGDAVAKPKTGQ